MLDYQTSFSGKLKNLSVLNVPRGQKAAITLTCDHGVYVETHFKKRSIICPGTNDCDLCVEGRKRQPVMYVTASFNNKIWMVRLPYSYPAAEIACGKSLYLCRGAKNNKMTYQVSLFDEKVEATHDYSDIWSLVLTLHRINHPLPLDAKNENHSRQVMQAICWAARNAAVRD